MGKNLAFCNNQIPIISLFHAHSSWFLQFSHPSFTSFTVLPSYLTGVFMPLLSCSYYLFIIILRIYLFIFNLVLLCLSPCPKNLCIPFLPLNLSSVHNPEMYHTFHKQYFSLCCYSSFYHMHFSGS